jgi:peptidoglycan/LPS O-acetylase OafA/YrhL
MRLTGLDVLRALAVLLVLGRHPPGGLATVMDSPSLRLWWNAGWVGVDLFFVLSGFLIGGLLFAEAKKTGRIRLGRFWVRRAFKILPPYAAFLAAL